MADEIIRAPAPWTLKGTVYVISTWTPSGKTRKDGLPAMMYSPLEGGSSSFAGPEAGTPVGGLSMMQIIRYTESPVGPYDELILAPGYHEYTIQTAEGKRATKKNIRITRIYVSQKQTCWNGRTNWNIPKHLAKFDFTENQDGSTTIKVFPHDTSPATLTTEASPSTTPFFEATVKPARFVPAFPLSLGAARYLGLDLTLVQPPLPAKPTASQGELPGTDRWCAIVPAEYSSRTHLCWFDLKQHQPLKEADAARGEAGVGENFWPGLGRWQVGVRMEDATIEFPEARYWDPPSSML